jgi:hypothetical protein
VLQVRDEERARPERAWARKKEVDAMERRRFIAAGTLGTLAGVAAIADVEAVDGAPVGQAAAAGALPPWESAPELTSVSAPARVEIPPGAAEVHIPLTAEGPISSTASVRAVRLVNVGGGGFDVGRDHADWLPPYDVFWRDGDELEHWLTLKIHAPESVRTKPGNLFRVVFRADGWRNDIVETVVVVVSGAVNELPAVYPHHRPPLHIDFSRATPAAELNVGEVAWSDNGYVGNAPTIEGTLLPQDAASTPCWRARLFHGYSQPGNGELGAYLNEFAFPEDAIDPISRGVDSNGRSFVRLHTRKLPRPVRVGEVDHRFQAAVLNGQSMDEWCARTGVYRTQVLVPNRVGAWSAFWVCGRNKENRGGRWPPEIDFFEHFNGAFGLDDWPMDGSTTTAGQHVGPFGSSRRERARGGSTNLWRLGFDQSVDIYAEIHDYACLITEDRVYHFFDGVETYSGPNMARHEDEENTAWDYMLHFTVAVKPPEGEGAEYDDGSGDMLIYGLQRYDLDAGYSLSNHVSERPWSNRKIMPDPDRPS